MVQFFQQQVLQSLGGLVLRGVDAGLRQQARGVDPGLREQFAQVDIFRFERGFLDASGIACHARRHGSRNRKIIAADARAGELFIEAR